MPVDAYTVSCAPRSGASSSTSAIGPDVAHDRHAAARWRSTAAPATTATTPPRPTRPSRVNFDGGIGLDTASYFSPPPASTWPSTWRPGDGRPGDDDRIFRDVESIIGSQLRRRARPAATARCSSSGLDGDDGSPAAPARRRSLGGEGNDHIDARDGAADSDRLRRPAARPAVVDLGAEASITGCAESPAVARWEAGDPPASHPSPRASFTTGVLPAPLSRRAAPGYGARRAALHPRAGPGGRARTARREGARAARAAARRARARRSPRRR